MSFNYVDIILFHIFLTFNENNKTTNKYKTTKATQLLVISMSLVYFRATKPCSLLYIF